MLFQDLDSDFFTRDVVGSKLDFSKGAFSYGLADQVVANAFGFVLFLLFSGLVARLGVMSVLALLSRLLRFINRPIFLVMSLRALVDVPYLVLPRVHTLVWN